MADPAGESFLRAIAEERARNVQRLNVFRFAGVATAFSLSFILPWFVPEARERQPDLYLYAAYVGAAGFVYWAGRSADRATRLGGLAIPLVDMPMVFLLNLGVLATHPGEGTTALFTLSAYVLLIIISAFSLEERQLVLAVVVAAVLEGVLQYRSQLDLAMIIGSTALLGGAGILCSYPSRRAIHLVRDIAAEQLFLSPEVGRVVRERGLASVMEQRRVELSIVACDLRGFTAFSEEATAEEVMALLQEYYDTIGAVVTEYGGTIKDHAGDGILSLVGAPVACPDHAERAVAMARKMRDLGREVLRRWSRGGAELGLGVGVASGTVTVGAIPGATRLEYVAVGPAVTLATRLADRAAAGQILIDERTVEAVAREAFEPLETSNLQGFARPVSIFAVR